MSVESTIGAGRSLWLRCEKCRPGEREALCEACQSQVLGDIAGPHACADCTRTLCERGGFPARHAQRHSELLGFCIDAEMLEVVEALNRAGMETTNSCVGDDSLFSGKSYIGFERLEDLTSLLQRLLDSYYVVVEGEELTKEDLKLVPSEYWHIRGQWRSEQKQNWEIDTSLYGLIGTTLHVGHVLALPVTDLPILLTGVAGGLG